MDAFDLDPRMVTVPGDALPAARPTIAAGSGDAAEIAAPDERYDAVFDFGIIHHVPDWRRALSEVHRVLRPGGRLYAEEVLVRFLDNRIARRLLEHPRTDRFDAVTFRAAIADAGFETLAWRDMWGCFTWAVAAKPTG